MMSRTLLFLSTEHSNMEQTKNKPHPQRVSQSEGSCVHICIGVQIKDRRQTKAEIYSA
jgi:hypothetical protein